MLRHVALDENRVLLRIQTRRYVERNELQAALAQIRRFLIDGDGMQVHEHVVTVVILLHLHPVAQGTEIVSNHQLPRRLNTREDYGFAFRFATCRYGGLRVSLYVVHNDSNQFTRLHAPQQRSPSTPARNTLSIPSLRRPERQLVSPRYPVHGESLPHPSWLARPKCDTNLQFP